MGTEGVGIPREIYCFGSPNSGSNWFLIGSYATTFNSDRYIINASQPYQFFNAFRCVITKCQSNYARVDYITITGTSYDRIK